MLSRFIDNLDGTYRKPGVTDLTDFPIVRDPHAVGSRLQRIALILPVSTTLQVVSAY